MYNTQVPGNWAMVKTVSDSFADRIRLYMRQFPAKSWWEETFRNCGRGEFMTLRLEKHNRKLSWLLQMDRHQRGENCVKVHDREFL